MTEYNLFKKLTKVCLEYSFSDIIDLTEYRIKFFLRGSLQICSL
jgi:hypothetical protein